MRTLLQTKTITSIAVATLAASLGLGSTLATRAHAQDDSAAEGKRKPAKKPPRKAGRRSSALRPAAAPPKPAPVAADKAAGKKKAGSRPKGPAAPPPKPGAAADDVPPGVTEAASKLTPFETGIDYKPTSPRTRVTFNLEDADLPDLVRLISQITGKRFILPGKTRSIKATVYAPTKVSAAEAYQAFLSILEINGMALVPAGRYLKIVESGHVEGRPIPLFTDDQGIPTGDRYLTRLQRVDNISAEDASKLLERFKSGDGSLTAYAPTNMLIITDTGTNIRRMMRILKVIDIERTGEQIWVEPVYHADAKDLAERLSEIFEPTSKQSSGKPAPKPAASKSPRKKGKAAAARPATAGATTVGDSGESRLTKILSDERTNSLIILATESAYLRILEMLKYLDVSVEGEGRIHVHHLQHSDAEEIASTLSTLVGGKSGGSKGKGKGKSPVGGGQSVFEGKVAVTAHKAANSLVITSSSHDYAALRRVIDMLDMQRKQVFIEAVIMELAVNRGFEFGTSFHGGIPNVPSDGSLSVLGFQAQNTITGAANADLLTGLAVGMQGPIIADSQQLIGLSLPAFGVAVSALANAGDANILSTPHLIAMDNVEAEISVGQNVPLQTSGQLTGVGALGGLGAANLLQGAGGLNSSTLGQLGNMTGMAGAVPRQDVGTTVTITPHINEANEIRLEITEEISEAGTPSESGNLGVVAIDQTHAKTEVVVQDQQTVVIGGLMRDTVMNAETKVPVLGDMPILGALFRDTKKTKQKRNLLLFLTPYIIRSPSDLRSIYERKMRERQEFLDRYFVFGDTSYETPLDYSRTKGLVAEIMQELALLRETRHLRAEAEAKPKPTHDPRPAVGTGAKTVSPTGTDMTIEPDSASGTTGAGQTGQD